MTKRFIQGFRQLGQHKLFLCLLLGIASLRLILLFVSQSAAHGDDSVVGIMALHILQGKEYPVYFYGQAYNGGGAVTAYLAAALFWIFGVHEWALKLVPLLFSLGSLVVVYLLVLSAYQERTAFLVAFLYATSVVLMKWIFDARGGYAEGHLLIPLVMLLYRSRCLEASSRIRDHLILGCICGFGFYILESFSCVIVTLLVIMFAYDKLFLFRAKTLGYIGGLLLGSLPMICHNILHGGENLRHVAEGDAVPLLSHIGQVPGVLWHTLVYSLPRLMTYDNLYGFAPKVGPSAYFEYWLVLGCICLLVLLRRRQLAKFFRSIFGRKPENPNRLDLETFFIIYLLVYLGLFSMHPLATKNARYLLFMEPVLSMCLGMVFARAIIDMPGIKFGRFIRICGWLLLAGICTNRLVLYAELATDDRIYGLWGKKLKATTTDDVIAYLHSNGLSHAVVEDFDLRWRILFISQGHIVAAALPGQWSRYPAFDQKVRQSHEIAYVVIHRGEYERCLQQRIKKHNLQYKSRVVDKNIIYTNLPYSF